MSGISPNFFYSRPRPEQTEYETTSPNSDISDIDVSDDDGDYNPSDREELNDSSDEIEVEEAGLLVEESSHGGGPRTPTPIAGPSTSRTPSPSSAWLYPSSRHKRGRRSTSRGDRRSESRSGESNVDEQASRTPSPVLQRRAARPAYRTRTRRRATARRRIGRQQPARITVGSWEWIDGTNFEPFDEEFDASSSGIHANNLSENSRESDFFNNFFSDELVDYIVRETNKFFYFMQAGKIVSPSSRDHQWHDVTRSEMRVFLALVIIMGVVKKNNIRAYWSTDPVVGTPMFGKVMSVNRFLNILRSLHFTDNLVDLQSGEKNKMQKIKYVFENLKNKFSEVFVPYKKLVIDESLVLWRGKLSFKQYIPSKRHRFGLKLFVLCDCKSGFVQNMILYTGKETDVQFMEDGLPAAVVKTLMAPYLGKNHTLYIDNWYTSPSLVEYLLSNQTGACGTVRRTRKHMPHLQPLERRGDVAHHQAKNILSVVWKDKKEVSLLTTVHRARTQESSSYDPTTRTLIVKPECVLDYNLNMRLVDKSDAMISSIECARKTFKWYKKMFFHMLDITVLNSCILFLGTTGKECTLEKFAIEMVRQTLEDNATERSSPAIRARVGHPQRLTGRHFIESRRAPEGSARGKLQRQCYVCNHSVRRPKVRKETRFHCPECNVPLCIEPCFKEYHTLLNF